MKVRASALGATRTAGAQDHMAVNYRVSRADRAPPVGAVIHAGLAAIRWWAVQSGKFRSQVLQGVRDEIRGDQRDSACLPPPTVASSSPLRLTDFGEKISAWMEAGQWAKSVVPLLEAATDAEPFELDELAGKYVEDQLASEYRNLVAKCAYEFGLEQEGVLRVLRVVLRDELLKHLRASNEESQPPRR